MFAHTPHGLVSGIDQQENPSTHSASIPRTIPDPPLPTFPCGEVSPNMPRVHAVPLESAQFHFTSIPSMTGAITIASATESGQPPFETDTHTLGLAIYGLGQRGFFSDKPRFTDEVRGIQEEIHEIPASALLRVPQGTNAAGTKLVRRSRLELDGYRWRKYGQKRLCAGDRFREYFKCTHPGCMAKRQVEMEVATGHMLTTRSSTHNHPKPSSWPRRVAESTGPEAPTVIK